MKKIAATLMSVLLLVMACAEPAYAECAASAPDTMQASMVDAHGHDDNTPQADCDNCLCGHHCHMHVVLPSTKAEHSTLSGQVSHVPSGETFLSHLHYPPSRPPQA